MPEKISRSRHYHKRKRFAKKPTLTLAKLTNKVSLLDKRTRGGTYRFQLRSEHITTLPVTGQPLVISLSDFAPMRPIFQAREDDGTINNYLQAVNKVRVGISGINYSINIDNVSASLFTISIFIVKLKRTAKYMVDGGTAGVFQGSDMTTEKDYTITPGPLSSNRAQLCMLNKNVFKILYHKRHVLGRKTSASLVAGETVIPSVTNRRDTTVDKYFKLKHDKIYKSPYGNGFMENAAREVYQPIAGRPYMILICQEIDATGLTGAVSFALQQVVTLKTIG